MCAATATAAKKPEAKPVTRGCQWVYDRDTSRRLVEDGIPAPLIVRVGENSWCYLVSLGADGVWTMAHVRADDSGAEEYRVDLGRGTCECPAHRYGRGKPCKHAAALRAALAWLEARS